MTPRQSRGGVNDKESHECVANEDKMTILHRRLLRTHKAVIERTITNVSLSIEIIKTMDLIGLS